MDFLLWFRYNVDNHSIAYLTWYVLLSAAWLFNKNAMKYVGYCKVVPSLFRAWQLLMPGKKMTLTPPFPPTGIGQLVSLTIFYFIPMWIHNLVFFIAKNCSFSKLHVHWFELQVSFNFNVHKCRNIHSHLDTKSGWQNFRVMAHYDEILEHLSL